MKYWVMTKRSILGGVSVALAVVLSGVVTVQSAVLPASAQPKRLPIYCVEIDTAQAALTFDASDTPDRTQLILDTLSHYGVTATFFVTGAWVEQNPKLAQSIRNAGHDLENHSESHDTMTELSLEEKLESIRQCNRAIETAVGKRPVYFRAPYGSYDQELLEKLENMGMQCVQWDVDSLDWKGASAQRIVSRVTGQVQPGSIIAFHTGGENTAEGLSGVIEGLRAKGYALVPISQLVVKGCYTVNGEGRQITDAL